MIYDEIGNELTYWPISGLTEGDSSEVLTIKITTPIVNGELFATSDDRYKVWARFKGVGDPYTDISAAPLDVNVNPLGDRELEIYVEVLSPIDGFERIPISVVTGTSTSAGW
jgi:hypothetical protein